MKKKFLHGKKIWDTNPDIKDEEEQQLFNDFKKYYIPDLTNRK